MSYNILAQSYVSPRYFPSSTPTALRVRPRTARLLAELSSAYGRLDVVALQEADRWAEVFGPALAGAGLGLAYKPRTEGRKPKSDGCGLAYNPARFTPIDARAVEFNDLDPMFPGVTERAVAAAAASGEPGAVEVAAMHLIRDNVGLAVVLEEVDPEGVPGKNEVGEGGGGGGAVAPVMVTSATADTAFSPGGAARAAASAANPRRKVIVACAHLYFNPVHPEVKLLQAWLLSARLAALRSLHGGAATPVVLCGDLNSLPQSAGMALLTGGAVPLGHPEVVAARLTPAEVAILEAAPLMRFESAYPMGSGVPGGQGGSPPLTTLTDHFSGMLDYILTSVDDDLAATAAPTTAALEDASPAAVCDADTAPAAAAATVATRHSALVVERTLELPTAEALAAAGVTGLPNEQFASDHLALVADLRWRE